MFSKMISPGSITSKTAGRVNTELDMTQARSIAGQGIMPVSQGAGHPPVPLDWTGLQKIGNGRAERGVCHGEGVTLDREAPRRMMVLPNETKGASGEILARVSIVSDDGG